MADTAGSALIALSITAGCMKWAVKPSVKLTFLSDELYVFSLREAEALIEKQVAEEDFERIAKKAHVANIGLELGDRVSGKRVLLVSDSAMEKISVGTSEFSSGRHKRQCIEIKAKKRCVAFVISIWNGENINPPEPTKYITELYSL